MTTEPRQVVSTHWTQPDFANLEAWTEHGRTIWKESEKLTWELSAWADIGDAKFGALKQFCIAHGMNYDRLKHYAQVSRNVPLKNRVDQLTFCHHLEVSLLPEAKQKKWLKRAQDEALTTSQLRAAIREDEGDQNALLSDGPPLKLPTKHALDLCAWLQRQPSDFWTAESKHFWKGQLKPIVEFWNGL